MHALLKTTLALATLALQSTAAWSSPPEAPKRTPITYAQLLAETVLYQTPDIREVAIYTRQNDSAPLALVANTAASTDPASLAAAIQVADSGKPTESAVPGAGARTLLPLLTSTGSPIGVLAILYASPAAPQSVPRLDQSIGIRDYLRLITPKRETLFDPYMKGYDATDTLAQRINQILLARHPDVNVIAIHVTAPGDAKNKVWGINRPNFIGRDSDEIDTDTEKTGRIVMQVIPATHRMEVHMPLLSASGALIGTICTVYLWKTVSEAADFYGRSLAIMEEVRQLTPANRNDLFHP